MGFATCINHLICRLCFCRWGWPNFVALIDVDGRNSIAYMASILEVWSWITIHVYSDINVKKYIEDSKLDTIGEWALRLVLIIWSDGYALIDEGGPIILLLSLWVVAILLRILIYFRPVIFFRMNTNRAIRVQRGHVEFSYHSFFCVHFAAWSSPVRTSTNCWPSDSFWVYSMSLVLSVS